MHFAKLGFNLRDHLIGCGADALEGIPELLRVPSRCPRSQIREGILRGIHDLQRGSNAECQALGLRFPVVSVDRNSRSLRLPGVISGVTDLVEKRLDRLCLAHSGLDRDELPRIVVVALGSVLDGLEADRHRADPGERAKDLRIIVDIPGELVHAERRKLATLRLREVKHRDNPKTVPLLRLRLAVFVPLVELDLVLAGSEDLDALLALANMTSMVLLPGAVAGDEAGVRALQGDEQAVVDRVAVEFAHAPEVILVAVAVEDGLDAGFELVGEGLDSLLMGWADGVLAILVLLHRWYPFRFFDNRKPRGGPRWCETSPKRFLC